MVFACLYSIDHVSQNTTGRVTPIETIVAYPAPRIPYAPTNGKIVTAITAIPRKVTNVTSRWRSVARKRLNDGLMSARKTAYTLTALKAGIIGFQTSPSKTGTKI